MSIQRPLMVILSLLSCLFVSQALANIGPEEIQGQITQFLSKNKSVRGSMVPVNSVRLGGIDGGGGLAVCTQEGGVKHYELLDSYQARQDFDLKLDLSRGGTFVEKVFFAMDRFQKVAPLRGALYKSWATEFLQKQIEWKRNLQIPQSFDEGKASVNLPKGNCGLVQVAFQRNDQQRAYPGQEKLIIIDLDIFERLSETDKAALILHEIIYLEARAYWHHTNSKYVRYFNALILSDAIKNEKQYADVISQMNERSKNADHGEFKKDFQDFRLWIPQEIRFSSGLACADFIGNSLCVQTEKVADTYSCKKGDIEFEIRNFKSYIARSRQKLFSEVSRGDDLRDDKVRPAKLFLNGNDFKLSDLTYKFKGAIVNLTALQALQFTVVDNPANKSSDGCLLELLVGKPDSVKAINMSTKDIAITGASTFSTEFQLTNGGDFELSFLGKSKSFTRFFLRNGKLYAWDDPNVFLLNSSSFWKFTEVPEGSVNFFTTGEMNREEYGYDVSL